MKQNLFYTYLGYGIILLTKKKGGYLLLNFLIVDKGTCITCANVVPNIDDQR
jgi:hypothetical protein